MPEQRTIRLIDVTLRDAHQCLWATRMTTAMMLPVAERLDRAAVLIAFEQLGGADGVDRLGDLLGGQEPVEHQHLSGRMFGARKRRLATHEQRGLQLRPAAGQ